MLFYHNSTDPKTNTTDYTTLIIFLLNKSPDGFVHLYPVAGPLLYAEDGRVAQDAQLIVYWPRF